MFIKREFASFHLDLVIGHTITNKQVSSFYFSIFGPITLGNARKLFHFSKYFVLFSCRKPQALRCCISEVLLSLWCNFYDLELTSKSFV